jgi:hypothetical protein
MPVRWIAAASARPERFHGARARLLRFACFVRTLITSVLAGLAACQLPAETFHDRGPSRGGDEGESTGPRRESAPDDDEDRYRGSGPDEEVYGQPGDCDGDPGAETDLATSPEHCGWCGNACPVDPTSVPTCSDGECLLLCRPGRADCDGYAPNGCETVQWDSCNDPCTCPQAVPLCAAATRLFDMQCAAFALAVDASEVYWTTSEGTWWAPKAGGAATALLPHGVIDFEVDGGDLYFIAGSELARMPRDGGAPTVLATGLVDPMVLAVGLTHVFVACGGGGNSGTTTGYVAVVPKIGGSSVVLANNLLAWPRSIAVDATHVYVAIRDGDLADGPDGSIVSVPQEGGAPTVLASGVSVTDIGVDASDVYFASEVDYSVRKVSIAGGAPVWLGSYHHKPTSLALGGGRVYWSTYSGVILGVPVGGGLAHAYANCEDQTFALAADGTHLYWGGMMMPPSGFDGYWPCDGGVWSIAQ